jgi:5-methylcytosine-specific restriction endonuclease McrA
MNYYEYLKSSEWKEKKKKFYSSGYFKKGIFCMCCKAKDKPLEVHHKTYKRLFKERLSDLFSACRECHQNIHNLHKTRKSQKNNLWSATYKQARKCNV